MTDFGRENYSFATSERETVTIAPNETRRIQAQLARNWPLHQGLCSDWTVITRHPLADTPSQLAPQLSTSNSTPLACGRAPCSGSFSGVIKTLLSSHPLRLIGLFRHLCGSLQSCALQSIGRHPRQESSFFITRTRPFA